MQKHRRTELAPLTALCAFALATASISTGAPARPNILFIFSDDHACQAISAYGSRVNKTPNIDRIANEGVLFRNNFCGNSICAPSRATVLTGKHNHKNGQMTNMNTFDGGQFTFPKQLQKAGYKTALIGKWHLRSNPTGFDHWMVYPGQGSYYNPDYLTAEGKKRLPGYAVEVTTDLAIDWMTAQKDAKQPFLMMCQYKAPHRTWSPGPEYLTMYDDVTLPEPPTLFDDYGGGRTAAMKQHRMGIAEHLYMGYDLKVPSGKGFPKGIYEMPRMTPAQKTAWDAAYGPKNAAFRDANLTGNALTRWKYQRYLKDYLRCVAAVDDNIGRLLDFLTRNGLEKNTLVMYASDQGFYLGEHGWFDKRWMYEESFRMPCVMKWPGIVKPGTVVEKLTQNIDFAPTFLEACGLEIPEEVQGRSLLPLAAGKTTDWRKSLYYHYYESPSEHGVPFHYGVRTDRHKLIHYYAIGEWELFDLEKDPRELRNVYDDSAYAKVRKDMHAELTRIRRQYDCTYGADNPDPFLKRQREKRAGR